MKVKLSDPVSLRMPLRLLRFIDKEAKASQVSRSKVIITHLSWAAEIFNENQKHKEKRP